MLIVVRVHRAAHLGRKLGIGCLCDGHGGTTRSGATLFDVMALGYPIWALKNSEPNCPPVPSAGTSEGTAFVSTVASFEWSEFPMDTNLDVKQRIMDKVDVLPSLTGWCVTGGRVNAARAVGVGCD